MPDKNESVCAFPNQSSLAPQNWRPPERFQNRCLVAMDALNPRSQMVLDTISSQKNAANMLLNDLGAWFHPSTAPFLLCMRNFHILYVSCFPFLVACDDLVCLWSVALPDLTAVCLSCQFWIFCSPNHVYLSSCLLMVLLFMCAACLKYVSVLCGRLVSFMWVCGFVIARWGPLDT